MWSEEFKEIYERKFQYKQEVVAHLEMCMKHHVGEQRQHPRHITAKQIYITEDLLYQIRLDLIETVWVQAGEVLIDSEVKKLKTIALAEWTDRLYLVAKRIEIKEALKKGSSDVKNLDHWMNIADWANKIWIKAQENNEKLEIIENIEVRENFDEKLEIIENIEVRENFDEKLEIIKNIKVRENFEKVIKIEKITNPEINELKLLDSGPKNNSNVENTRSTGHQNDPKCDKSESWENAPKVDKLKLLGTDPKINQKTVTTGSLGPQNDPKRNKSESVTKAPEMDVSELLVTDSKIDLKIKN